MIEQSIPNGTQVQFNFKDLKRELIDEFGLSEEEDGSICIVDSLATFTELGDRDYEYYNITNTVTGREYEAISGYHLDPIVYEDGDEWLEDEDGYMEDYY